MEPIKIIQGPQTKKNLPNFLSPANCQPAHQYHRSLDVYQPTPLVSLPALARRLGVKAVYIKDESYRFGLNAFKGLGSTYAIHQSLAQHPEKTPVFVTATDGNHGRAVAWAAARLGSKAKIFMPKGSEPCRVEAIRAIENAEATVLDMNYDQAVLYAFDYANQHGFTAIQDTGFEGYEQVPNWITQGYTTMTKEALAQMQQYGTQRPSHVFVQAGVGSFAGSVTGYLAHVYGDKLPHITIVEASPAACLYRSIECGDGAPHSITGDPETIMAGLNCGTPNLFTWPVLRDFAAQFAKCPDWVAELGMKTLAHPLAQDPRVVSGESGAVGAGLLVALLTMEAWQGYKDAMHLGPGSEILLFSTEGDTDPVNYARIVNKV